MKALTKTQLKELQAVSLQVTKATNRLCELVCKVEALKKLDRARLVRSDLVEASIALMLLKDDTLKAYPQFNPYE